MVFSTITSGRILDHEFRRTRRKLERQQDRDNEKQGETGIENELKSEEENIKKPLDPNDLLDFPLEHARLRHLPFCASRTPSSPIHFALVESC